MHTSLAAHHLAAIRTLWPHLDDALDQPRAAWYGVGLNAYLQRLDQHDRAEAAGLRALERDPQQIGETAAPLNLTVLDAARLVETTLVHLADTIAPQITRNAIGHAPADWAARGWTRADRDHRNAQADREQGDPRRWRHVGLRTAEYAAGWLLARVENREGPFWTLTAAQHHHIEIVAAGCAARIETALGLLGQEYTAALPCPGCAGRVLVTAGGGGDPEARCAGDCGRVWTMADTAAA